MIGTSISCYLFITEKNKVLKIFNLFMYGYLLYKLILNDTFGCYLALISAMVLYFVINIIKKERKASICVALFVFILISLFTNKTHNNIAKNNIKTLSKDIHTIATTDPSDKEFGKTGTTRMRLWQQGLSFFFEHPILGYGPDNLGPKYAKVGNTQDRPHNLLIQLATTSGFPGLILYVSALRNNTN